MPVIKHKPTTPGLRGATKRDFSTVTDSTPTKSLLVAKPKTGGRNHHGSITVRHIGGGHKQRYRIIDFNRTEVVEGVVKTIEYDPNRSARIALIESAEGKRAYIIAPKDIVVGAKVTSGDKSAIRVGSAMQLKNIPTGVAIHNIELSPGRGASLVRSAGLSASIVAQEELHSVVKLPSGELRRIHNISMATIGEVSNANHENTVFGKAGRKRWMGIRPTVRGKAMNPNTHPHGGGEGNTPIGIKKGPKTPWGAPALGHRTRDRNKPSSKLIIRRRAK